MDWKNDADCPVLITFDVDLEELWYAAVRKGQEDMGNIQTVSMGEYGAQAGVPRILDLLSKHGVSAAFFVPGLVAENYPDVVRSIHDEGHEIGNHGYRHDATPEMSAEFLREGYERANRVLEDLTGERPVGMRVPSSSTALSEDVFAHLVDMGFEYNSNLKGNDDPYRIETDTGDIVELPWHWSLDDAMHFNFNPRPPLGYQSGMSDPDDVLNIWKTEFDVCREEGRMYHLVMHPQVIGRPHRSRMLDEILDYVTDSNAWVAQPRELVRYLRDSQQQIPAQPIPSADRWNEDL